MRSKLLRLLRDEEGVTAVEYALMLAAIAGIIIVGVAFFGGKVNNTFVGLSTKLP